MTTLTMRVQIAENAGVESAVAAMQAIAALLGVTIEGELRGIRVFVRAGDNPREIVHAWKMRDLELQRAARDNTKRKS
jgi:hypothetical protein